MRAGRRHVQRRGIVVGGGVRRHARRRRHRQVRGAGVVGEVGVVVLVVVGGGTVVTHRCTVDIGVHNHRDGPRRTVARRAKQRRTKRAMENNGHRR